MCLTFRPPNEEEFRILDKLISMRDEGFNIGFALVSERAMETASFEDGRSLRKRLATWEQYQVQHQGIQLWISNRWADILASPVGLPSRLKTESANIKRIDAMAKLIDRPGIDERIFDELSNDFERQSPVHRLVEKSEGLEIGSLRFFPRSVIRFHQRLIFSRLALRLRRYYDQHGKFPERLDELCDESMPTIRIDWFQNHPITYKPSAKGFRLETPAAILKPDERHVLDKTPILSDYGLELELKTLSLKKP
jgi:hypothetical protein